MGGELPQDNRNNFFIFRTESPVNSFFGKMEFDNFWHGQHLLKAVGLNRQAAWMQSFIIPASQG
jgi:hypothetical protein